MTMTTDTRLALLEDARNRHDEWRVCVESTLGEISRSISLIAETSRLAEIRHSDHKDTTDRIFMAIEKVQERIDKQSDVIKAIDADLPALRETRKWVIAAILAVVVAAGGFVWNQVYSAPIHIPDKG